MNPDALVPFAWEIVWFSAGALFYAASPKAGMAFVGLLFIGGTIGSFARNYDPDDRVIPDE